MLKQPIVIFDSGVGGTSILKELVSKLPKEDFIYLADSKNAPYGEKSQDKIVELSVKNTELALKLKAKLIVVACNTATTNAIQHLRTRYPIPFIGIEPAIKPAALQSEKKRIGILATKGTLSSELFKHTSEYFAQGITVVEVVGKGIVEAVESGKTKDPEFINALSQQLKPFIEQKIDHLVLGCTHFPYIIPILKNLLPSHIKIIDSGRAVAKQTEAILEKHQLKTLSTSKGHIEMYSNAENLSPLRSLVHDITEVNITYKEF